MERRAVRALHRSQRGPQRRGNRSATDARELRLQDLVNFNRWLELRTSGDTETANLYERRFHGEFRPAFPRVARARSAPQRARVRSPLQMPEYVLKDKREE